MAGDVTETYYDCFIRWICYPTDFYNIHSYIHLLGLLSALVKMFLFVACVRQLIQIHSW